MCAKKTSKSKGNNNNERRKKNSIALERLILMFSMKHEHCSRQSRIQIYTQLCHFCLPVFIFYALHWNAIAWAFFALSLYLLLCVKKRAQTHTTKQLKDFTSHLYVMMSGCNHILTERKRENNIRWMRKRRRRWWWWRRKKKRNWTATDDNWWHSRHHILYDVA